MILASYYDREIFKLLDLKAPALDKDIAEFKNRSLLIGQKFGKDSYENAGT